MAGRRGRAMGERTHGAPALIDCADHGVTKTGTPILTLSLSVLPTNGPRWSDGSRSAQEVTP